jgi:acyl-CoA thioesterase
MSNEQRDQQLAERLVDAMMARDAFSQWLGIKVLAVRPRHAAVGMSVRAEMVNGFGVAHGGIVYSLADSALAFAANTHGRVTVAIENSIAYPKAVHVGDELVAVAEEESASSRLGYYRVTVRRGESEIVALFRGTVYRTKKDFFSGNDAGVRD